MKPKYVCWSMVLVLVIGMLGGCGQPLTPSGGEAPSPTEIFEEVPEEVRAALDAALAFLRDRYGDQVPPASLSWVGRRTSGDLVGWVEYQFVPQGGEGTWVVTVSYAVVSLEHTLYQVVVMGEDGEVQWEVRVNPAGRVAEAPEQAVIALDAALAYLRENYAEQAPSADLAWVEQRTTPEGLLGAESFQYTADGWVATLSYPVVLPDLTVYTVVVVNEGTGFQWQGEVDAAGQVKEMPDVTFEGISFSYEEAIAADVIAEIVPGVEAEDRPGWDVWPDHVQFSFEGYVLADTFHPARILVYPVQEYERKSEIAAETIENLRQLLAERPIAPDRIPFLPIFNAEQLIRAQVAYLDFQNGSGVRFLTQYSQAVDPINNKELFYTFQGLTDDGMYYIAAILPVSNPILPADGSEIPGGDYDAFAETFGPYLAGVEEQLNAQGWSSFAPDLSLLDALIRSLATPQRIESVPF